MIALVLSLAAMVPVDDASVAAAVGVDEGAGAVVEVVAAARGHDVGPFAAVPYVVVDGGWRGPRLAVQGGAQLRIDVVDFFAVAGRASAGAFVAGDVDVGATGSVAVDAVFSVGPVVIAVGPVVDGAVTTGDGRFGLGGHAGVVVGLGEHVDLTVDLGGGYDGGGRFGAPGDGALFADALAGVRLRL